MSPLNPAVALDHIHTTLVDALAHADPNDVIDVTDSATYPSASALVLKAGLLALTVRAAESTRPCVTTYDESGAALPIGLQIAEPIARLDLSGLLLSGGRIQIDAPLDILNLTGCTLDPLSARGIGSLVANDSDDQRDARYLLCRCITGRVSIGSGVGRLTVADSIVDGASDVAIDGLAVDQPPRIVHLERVTMLGTLRCVELHASESVLDDVVTVEDRQVGCIRFSRFERGSVLPRKFACVPTDEEQRSGPIDLRCVEPIFDSRRFSRPDYARLAVSSPPELAAASEAGSEIGAFTTERSAIRLENLRLKLREFMPVGLSALALAET